MNSDLICTQHGSVELEEERGENARETSGAFHRFLRLSPHAELVRLTPSALTEPPSTMAIKAKMQQHPTAVIALFTQAALSHRHVPRRPPSALSPADVHHG
jgi:ribonuclease D